MKNRNFLTLIFVFALGFLSHFASAQTVYVTESGKKYHKKNCSIVNEGKKGLELAEAKKQGYEPCSVCKPETQVTAPSKKADAADKPKKKK